MAKTKKAGHSFEDYFKRALNPMLVLVLLKEESMYVYQMQQELKRRSGGTYTISLLYPVLYRLEEQGYLVLSQQQITEDNRVRGYYSITPEGLEYLEHIKEVYRDLCQAVEIILQS